MAYDVVNAIVEALSAQPAASGKGHRDPFLAILFAEAAQALDKPVLMQRACEHLTSAIDALATSAAPIALQGGWCGIGWLTCWLKERLRHRAACPHTSASLEIVDACRAIDVMLARIIGQREEQHAEYDLLFGVVGVGVYALQRRPAPASATLLESVLARLEFTARTMPEGISWLTPPEILPPHIRADAPDGLYNLGVAHGVPGIIALLGQMYSAGAGRTSALKLARGAIAWSLRQQLPYGEGARYPNWIVPGTDHHPARMAWCYGGLGLSAAVMIAGRAMGNEAWQSEAVRLATLESQRDPARTGVRDACLCHGAAGNGLIFQRFHAATGEGDFHDAAHRCFELALQMWEPDQGIGGYRFEDGGQLSDDGSFLSGSAGVALGLLAATSAIVPSWDRLLLTDIPC